MRTRLLLGIAFCALLMLPVAWAARGWVSPDGIAYLEIATKAASGSPMYLFTNGYWSPAYPALVAAAFKLFHPAIRSELLVVRALDWLIYVGAGLCFAYFLQNLVRRVGLADQAIVRAFTIFACTLFFVSNLDASLWMVSPDVLLEGLVYLAAGVSIRLSMPRAGLRHYTALGIALAAAYSAKAILFPLSLVLLGLLFLRPVERVHARKGVVLAGVAFLLAASPLIAILSRSSGHVTFGDSGRVNYARHVNGVNFFGLWAGGLPPSAVPIHPARKLSSDPLIVKFEGAFEGTWWPFWYDQTYWYEGVKPHFNVADQWMAYMVSLGLDHKTQHEGVTLFALARRWIPLFAGLCFLAGLGVRPRSLYAVIQGNIWLLLWPTCAILVYAGVVLHYRYLVSFAVLGWASLFAAAIVVRPARSAVLMLAMALSLLLIDARTFLSPLVRLMRPIRTAESDAGTVAGKIQSMGIHSGDQLAMVGFPFRTYFARLAGANFTEIIAADPAVLSTLPAAEVHRVLDTLRANGAKALVSLDAPAFANDSGWVNAGQEIYVRLLP